LEHFTGEEGKVVLKYWYSLLKVGGRISVSVPNFDIAIRGYLANPNAQAMRILCDLYFYSYVQESLHKYTYNEALLKLSLTEAGFVDLTRMQIDHPYFVSPVDWQVGYTGIRS
jgi:hypothetical protein